MKSELLQLITLTAFGNAALFQRLNGLPATERLPARHFQNEVLSFDGGGALRDKDGKRVNISHSDNTRAFDEWIQYLADDGAQRLSLSLVCELGSLPTRIASAFTSFYRQSIIIVEYKDHTVAWTPHRTFNESLRQSALTISYQSHPVTLMKDNVDLMECKQRLRSVLSRAADFATRGGGKHWAEIFHKALLCLETEVTTAGWDAFPTQGYSLDAWQLLRSVSVAWVFGGMGSWNDWAPHSSYSARESDNTIDDDLFFCLIDCLVAATNSFNGDCAYQPLQKTNVENPPISTFHQAQLPTQQSFSIRKVFQEISQSRLIAYVVLALSVIAIRYIIFLFTSNSR